jgi:hypothetical protein
MRRTAVALVFALIVLMLVGCAGAAEPETAEPTTAQPPAAPATVVEPVVDRSPVESGYPAPFPEMKNIALPEAVQQKLDAKRPMLLFFFDSAQQVTTAQRSEVDTVMREYRGLIDLLTFDAAAGATNSTGAAAQAAATFAGELDVKSTPYIILVNEDGIITWRWLGYVDSEIIGREVLSATE